ncbi:MAG TPA: cysteine synthase family protein, partial [Bellilinea sp.]|nr:cysteine synthase family protein [Bellilinea sp.]
MDRNIKIADSMLDLIGNIPLVRLNRIGKDTGCEFLVKPEFLNPSGSIKDRIAKLMVEKAEEEGRLHEGSTIIEATTGNTGTALAFLAAVKGYRMRAYSPTMVANNSRMGIMKAYGAEVEPVDITAYMAKHIGESMDADLDSSVHGGHVELLPRQMCLELEREDKDLWWARQFANELNDGAHEVWTAKEIIEQTDGQLDAFVASVGTGGTILGVGRALKAFNPNIRIIGVEPAGKTMMGAPENFPLLPGVSDGIIPKIFDRGFVERVYSIPDAEAIDMAHKLTQ